MAEIGLIKRVKYAGDVHAELLKAEWDLDTATAFVNNIPDADVAPVRHGRWLDVREKRLFGEHYFLCLNCKSRNGLMIPFNYCPNCGAKMDGGFDNG